MGKSKRLIPATNSNSRCWSAIDQLFIAMAYEREGHHEEARDALGNAAPLLASLPGADADLGDNQASDWIVCQVVLREAETLINANAPTTKPAASTQPLKSK